MFSKIANLKNLWHVLLMVGILTATLYFSKSTITGNVVVNDIQRVPVNINIDKSHSKVISLPDKTTWPLNYFSVTGDIKGAGLVKIYLDNGAGIKRLVYSNEKGLIQSSLKSNVFTSLKSEAKLFIDTYSSYDYLAPEQVEVSSGSFRDVCIETCSLENNLFNSPRYELIFYVEKGTDLKIDEILYS